MDDKDEIVFGIEGDDETEDWSFGTSGVVTNDDPIEDGKGVDVWVALGSCRTANFGVDVKEDVSKGVDVLVDVTEDGFDAV